MPNYRAFGVFARERGIGLKRDVPLASMTTLKVGGLVPYFAVPKDEEELSDVIGAARECDVPWRILGSGANLLVHDAGVPGVVIRLSRFVRREFGEDGVAVQAGYNLARLVKEAIGRNLAGLECLAGVPASVGGAIAMNAGGRHGEISQIVRSVDVLEANGRPLRLQRDEVGFRYRATRLGSRVVLGATIDLKPDPSVRERYEAILEDKKRTQPLGSPNAGCIFKNPPGDKAGRLIEQAGMKGERVGRAHVSRKHANFIVNEGGAKACDVLALIERIRRQVRTLFGVSLEEEILIW